LHLLPVAAHEKVSGHSHGGDFLEIRVRPGIEAVGEEALDRVAAVFAGRQADRVDDQQADLGAGTAETLPN